MKHFFRYLKKYRKEAVCSPLFKMLEASFELLVPLLVARIIDSGIGNGDTAAVWRDCAFLVALGVIGLSLSVTAQYFAAKAAVGFVKDMRHDLFSQLLSFSYGQTDVIGTSTLITRMTSDANQVQTGINLTLRLLLRSPFVVFGAMIMAFTIDVKSALIFAVAIPVLALVVFGIMLITMPLYRKVQGGLDKVLLSTRENLEGARVLRAFCKEEDEIRSFDQRNDTLTRLQKKVGKLSSLLNPLTFALINLAVIVLMAVGAIQVDHGRLTSGQVVALYNYMSQILVELIKLANLIINITKSLASAKRIQTVFDMVPQRSQGTLPYPEKSEICFEHVSLRYPNAGANSVTDLSFRVKPGQTVGIIGGTGCGKTTLVNLIPGFYPATEGTVSIGGQDVQSIDPTALHARIGIVPQKAVLFSGTVRENLLWGDPNATDQELETALKIAQADGVVRDKGGLDFRIEQGGRNLSGGQRQRLTIARALVGKPDILILDDSASALDYATDAALRKAISSLRCTVFLVSQRAASVLYADQIIVLEDGSIAGIGTHEELLGSCPAYAEIYHSQFQKEAEA